MRLVAGGSKAAKVRKMPCIEEAAAAFANAMGISPNISTIHLAESQDDSADSADEVTISVDLAEFNKTRTKNKEDNNGHLKINSNQ